MSLYHGTSANAALKILEGNIQPSKDGHLYCFWSAMPESKAGALCFATGKDLRKGVIDTKNLLSHYFKLNPDFPKGLKGAFCKMALNAAISSWQKTQRKLMTPPYADRAAIIVFENHEDTEYVIRGGFINEARVPAATLPSLVVEKAYVDDVLLAIPEVQRLRKFGLTVEPLSAWAEMVDRQVKSLTPQKTRKQDLNI